MVVKTKSPTSLSGKGILLKPIGLLKFLDNQYSIDMINNGNICFNTIDFFRNIEKKTERHRHDPNEGFDLIKQTKDILKITIKGRDFKIHPNSNPVKIKLSNGHEFTHLYCLTIIYNKAIIIDNKERVFNPNMFFFGDSFIFIHYNKINEFNDKIINHCKSKNIKCESKKVEYIDIKNFSGELGIFKKDKFYEYQNEFRIALSLNTNEKYIMNLGNLSDCVFGPIQKHECINLVKNGEAQLN